MVIWQEMSRGRNDQKTYLSVHTRTIVEHLMKLYYFRNSQWKNKWIKDLNAGTPDVPVFTHNHKRPDKKFIYEFLWNWTADDVSFNGIFQKVLDILKDYEELDTSEVIKRPEAKEVKALCTDYFEWASGKLAISGMVVKSDVEAEVNKLLSKYEY